MRPVGKLKRHGHPPEVVSPASPSHAGKNASRKNWKTLQACYEQVSALQRKTIKLWTKPKVGYWREPMWWPAFRLLDLCLHFHGDREVLELR